MSPLPKTPHDWAVWLFALLEDVRALGNGVYRGRLPATYDFEEVVRELELRAPSVSGVVDSSRRTIEFLPASGNVYETIEQLVGVSANLGRVPEVFTVRELAYTSPSEPMPDSIKGYLHAVQLWGSMSALADHVVPVPASIFFIETPSRKLEITRSFEASEMQPLLNLEEFNRDFIRTDFHREQKRDIVRAALLDTFPGHVRVTLGALVRGFEEFFQRVKAAYALFAADFSYQKIRSEIEKQNLDDTLRLNKTLADIQNQLLALPAALILAAAGFDPSQDAKNVAIVIGVVIFAILMVVLVNNQKNSVKSIEYEVNLRRNLVTSQPSEVSSRFEGAFADIGRRVNKQRRTLNGVLWLVAIVVACVGVMAWRQGVSASDADVQAKQMVRPSEVTPDSRRASDQ